MARKTRAPTSKTPTRQAAAQGKRRQRAAPGDKAAADGGSYELAREGTGFQQPDGTTFHHNRSSPRTKRKVANPPPAGYHRRRMENAENLEDRLIRAARAVPPEKRKTAMRAAIRCLEQIAAGEVTERAKAARPARAMPAPRLKWAADAEPGEDPAHFAHRAGYVHRGMISTEDRSLHKKLFNWLRTHKWPADVPYIPTLPEWNEQQAAKLPELLAEVGVDMQEVQRLGAVVRRVGASPVRMPDM